MENPFEQIDRRLSNIEQLLLAIKHSPVQSLLPPNVLPDLLSVKEAAKLVNLAVPTIYGLVGRNEIPFHKRNHSKKLYFSRHELEDWIRQGRRKTVAECTAEVRSDLKLRAQ